jgi:hypothetical protein
MGLLDGTDPAPPKTLKVLDDDKKEISIPNPDYDSWLARDQTVLSFLTKGLNQDILAQVLGVEHARDLCTAIEELFSSQSRSRVNMLRVKLSNTKKLDMTCTDYITKILCPSLLLVVNKWTMMSLKAIFLLVLAMTTLPLSSP